MKFFRLTILALCLSMAFSAALAETRLVIGESAEAVSLDPRVENDVPSYTRIQTIMEPLITFDTGMELAPRLAESWEVSEDGLDITFTLREGVMFHNGETLSADDVVYTFEWVMDAANASVHRAIYNDIQSVEAISDSQVVFRLEAANAFVLNNIALMPIVPASVADSDGFRDNPIGTGPLMFESWARDDRMVLRAFDDYWGGRPQVDVVEFRAIPDDTARLLAFEAGDIDLYQGRVVPSEVANLEANPNVTVQRIPGLTYTYVAFNQQVEGLQDVRVRQAISHLIDRDAIISRVKEGTAEEAISMFPSNSPWFHEGVPRFSYNPERAAELLAEAGVSELSLRLHTNQNPIREQIAEILAFELGRLGIEVTISIEEWGAFLGRIQSDEGDYDMFILGWSRNVDPDRAIARQFDSQGGSNETFFANERIDEILALGRTMPLLSDEQLAMYNEAQEIIVDEAPYAFIFFDEEVGVQQANISGWDMHPYVTATFQDIHLFEVQ